MATATSVAGPRQVVALEDAIGAVERRECEEQDIIIDPCVITQLTVDGASANDLCNGDLNSGFVQPFHELAGLIDSLAAPGSAVTETR